MQDKVYQNRVLPPEITSRLAVEAGTTLGWERWVGDRGRVIGIDRYGASAPGDVVMLSYGLSVANVIDQAMDLLRNEALSQKDPNNRRP